MDTNAVERAHRAIVERYGPWTATNIDLGHGVFTRDPNLPCVHPRLIRFGQLVSDFSDRPFSALRILDLACLEGEYAIEFARQGAEVVGIEGRSANIEKARLAKETLGLKNLSLLLDDVRNLSLATHGAFDVVLCSGILYHLDAPDFVAFLERIGEVCTRCAIVDTHVSRQRSESFEYKGRRYWGSRFIEHHSDSTASDREKSLWASLDNRTSFWPTRPSLYNALTAAGFTSIHECHTPVQPGQPYDRITLVAVKGTPYRPAAGSTPDAPVLWSEKEHPNIRYYIRRYTRSLIMRMPYRLARLIKRLAG